MDALDLVRRMAANNAWANLRLHRAVAELDDAAYRARRTSFFPSLHATLVHILFVDLYYVDALEDGGAGDALFDAYPAFEQAGTFAELRARQRAVDQRLIAFTAAIDALDVEVRIPRRTHVQTDRRDSVLLHLYQHQIHHRGQAHAMLAGTAVRPPQLDEFFLRDELPLRDAELRELGLPAR